jgi:hypothetical protein
MLIGGSVTLPCGTRNISQILLHSEQFCEILEWPVTIWWPAATVCLVFDCRLNDQGSVPVTDRTYPVAPVSTPALNPIQPPNHKASAVERGRGVMLTTNPHLVPRSRMIPSPRVVCVVVSWQLYFTFAKSNKFWVSVVNNKVCVVVMLKIQVMYIMFR